MLLEPCTPPTVLKVSTRVHCRPTYGQVHNIVDIMCGTYTMLAKCPLTPGMASTLKPSTPNMGLHTSSACLRGWIDSWPWCEASCACCKQPCNPISLKCNQFKCRKNQAPMCIIKVIESSVSRFRISLISKEQSRMILVSGVWTLDQM